MVSASHTHFILLKREERQTVASTRATQVAGGSRGKGIQTARLKVAPLMMLAPNPHRAAKGGMSANESHWPPAQVSVTLYLLPWALGLKPWGLWG